MATWRDGASATAQQDLDGLFNQAALLAQTLLMRNREFYPFGAAVNAKGAIALSTPLPDGEHPTANDVMDGIGAEFAAQKKSLRATAIVAMASVGGGEEAVRVELEHVDGIALMVALPYTRDPKTNAVTYGAMLAREGERHVWATARRTPTASASAKAARATSPRPPASKGGTPSGSARAKSEAPSKVKPAASATGTKGQAKPAARAKKPSTEPGKGRAKDTAEPQTRAARSAFTPRLRPA